MLNLRKRDNASSDRRALLDGLNATEFQDLLRERADGSAMTALFKRVDSQKVGVVSGLTFKGRFPWINFRTRTEHPSDVSKMSGIEQTIRSCADFHGRPIYYFVLAMVDAEVHFIHVRTLFRLPLATYGDRIEDLGGGLVLVRLLEACPDLAFALKACEPKEHAEKRAKPLQSSMQNLYRVL